MSCLLGCVGSVWGLIPQGLQNFLQTKAAEVGSRLWNLAADEMIALRSLESLTEELDNEKARLEDSRRQLLAEIEEGERQNKERTEGAKKWLEEVNKVVALASEFRVPSQQRAGSSEGSSLSRSEAAKCLKQFKRLKAQRSSLTPLIQGPPPPAVVPLPSSSNHDSVGAEETLSEIRRLVMEVDEVRIIGIYGMGGIGKTNLLKEIHNELLPSEGAGGFDLVISVIVSREPDVLKIQEDIGVRLGYSRSNKQGQGQGQGQGQTLPDHRADRVQTLLSALSKKKFLLLLDDLWEKLDLGAVGVPVPSLRNGSKVVFTTRSLEVCNGMDAQRKVKVALLDPASSWELFCQKLGRGEDQWDPSVRSLAEDVCRKCGGLPITLITVGRAMADATTRPEWEAALTQLKGIPVDLGDMEEKVLRLLKFSFDRLKDASARECLLYCALFSEDRTIDVDMLIEYWVGEGLLDRGSFIDPIHIARSRGHLAIKSLKSACLLEDGYFQVGVKLHDTVRKMALWITSGQCDGEKGNMFLVNTREGLTRVPTPERWTEATRISLMESEMSVLPKKPECHNLHTLLLWGVGSLMEIPGGFFQFMPRLRVLDLSFTEISHLPPGIGSLVELRYLNLSDTYFLESLPVELGMLTKLRQLRLERTWSLKSIPHGAISSLAGLQALNMFVSFCLKELRGGREEGGSDWEEGDHEGRRLSLKDLGGLKQLEELGVTIQGMTEEGMQALQQNFKKLCESIRFLSLYRVGSESFDLPTCLNIMKELRKLEIFSWPHLKELILDRNQLAHSPYLEELELKDLPLARISWTDASIATIFKYLVQLSITECEALEHVTWIRDLPCMEKFYLDRCSKIEELIVVEEVMMGQNVADSFFPKLRQIALQYLPNLRSICRHPLMFPSLEKIFVWGCPELKKLPLALPTAEKIKVITGEKEWWDALEWDHEDVRSRFLPYYFKLPN